MGICLPKQKSFHRFYHIPLFQHPPLYKIRIINKNAACSETPFSKKLYYIETSHLTCNANQLTGFYMIRVFTKGVSEHTIVIRFPNYYTQSKINTLKSCYTLPNIRFTQQRTKKQRGKNIKTIKIHIHSMLSNIVKTGSEQIEQIEFFLSFLFNQILKVRQKCFFRLLDNLVTGCYFRSQTHESNCINQVIIFQSLVKVTVMQIEKPP